MENSIPFTDSSDRTPSEIPYLSENIRVRVLPKSERGDRARDAAGNWQDYKSNFQKAGGYESADEVVIKPGEKFLSNREYADWTRFPARIRAAATALRDTGNFGLYSISHRESVLGINRVRDDFAPTADKAQPERATKLLLARGAVKNLRVLSGPRRLR